MTERGAPPDGSLAPGPDLSVILPAYNEAKLISAGLDRLRAHLRGREDSWEIVVVDDGSTDETAARVEAASRTEPAVRLIRIPRNSGKWSALARGLLEARGRVLAATDTDLSYSLEDLDAAVLAVKKGAGLATGTRSHPESRINLPFGLFPYLVRRWIAGVAFRSAVRLLFGLPVSDTQCGLKVFSRETARAVVPLIRTGRFLADIEVFLAARNLGIRVQEIPVNLRYLSGSSSIRVVSELPRAIADLIWIKTLDLRGAYRRE